MLVVPENGLLDTVIICESGLTSELNGRADNLEIIQVLDEK
jgi:hypothetical protein